MTDEHEDMLLHGLPISSNITQVLETASIMEAIIFKFKLYDELEKEYK
jgi:hypothetical protein